jgi:hypothetical protein
MKPSLKGHYIDITNTLGMIANLKPRKFVTSIRKQTEENTGLLRLPFEEVFMRYDWGNGIQMVFRCFEEVLQDGSTGVTMESQGKAWIGYGFGISIEGEDKGGWYFYNTDLRGDRHYYVRDDPETQSKILSICLPIINAIIMLNCKNVRLIDEPRASYKRMMNKHKKKKKVIYKILHIHPIRIKNIAERESYESGLKRSLHICRGHLRTYTEEKPLFGKVIGTFFIPAHLRGDEKVGTVVKDYQLEKE